MSRYAPLVALAVLACAPEPEPEPDPDPPFRCDVDESDTPDMDERLLRWPYLTSVDTDSAVIQWGLPAGMTGSIEWGFDDDFGTTVQAETQEVDALVDPIQMQVVRLTDLKPGRGYCYRVLLDGEALTGPLAIHTAPPLDTEEPVRFLVMGDYGNGSEIALTIYDRIREHYGEFDLFVTTGDNAYSDGTWADWQMNIFDVYRDLHRRVPYAPVPGNHDYRDGDIEPMLTNFVLPENALRDEDQERYYSFDWGPIHFTMADSQFGVYNLTEAPGDDMMDWMHADLAANQDRPWRFAVWHHPLYLTHPDRAADSGSVFQLGPAAEAGEVDVVLNGHNHSYERFSNIRNREKVERGTTYVVTGGGGASTYPVADDGGSHPNLPLRDYGAEVNHFMLFEVDRCTVTGRAIDLEGTEFDTWELDRC